MHYELQQSQLVTFPTSSLIWQQQRSEHRQKNWQQIPFQLRPFSATTEVYFQQ